MLPKLRNAQYRKDYRVWLQFDDGVEGEVDLKDELWGEVFEPLKNLDKFSKCSFSAQLGTIVWENGADFAPEFLYQRLRPDYELKPTPKSKAV